MDERSDLWLTTHDIHKTQASMRPAELEPAVPAREWPQTHVLDSSATGINYGMLQSELYLLSAE